MEKQKHKTYRETPEWLTKEEDWLFQEKPIEDWSREEMIRFLRKCVTSRKEGGHGLSKNRVDPLGRGSSLAQVLRTGKGASDQRLREMCVTATHLIPVANLEDKQDTTKFVLKVENKVIVGLLDTVDKQNQEIQRLQKKVEALANEIDKIREETGIIQREIKETKDERIMGWKLTQRRTDGVNQYWYAGKMVAGKQRWIYIGKNKEDAPKKISQKLLERPEYQTEEDNNR